VSSLSAKRESERISTVRQNRVQLFTVNGLFGHNEPKVEFSRGSAVTILTGPNGSGKTHTLKMLRALLAMDFPELLQLPYTDLSLDFSNKTSINVSRKIYGEKTSVTMEIKDEGRKQPHLEIDSEYLGMSADSRRAIAIRREREYAMGFNGASEIIEEERVRTLEYREAVLDKHPTLKTIAEEFPPTFIDTKRLDTAVEMSRDARLRYGEQWAEERGVMGRMREYVSEIRSQITDARRESLKRSQRADQEFAANLLDKSRDTVRIDDLTRRYQALSTLSDELSQNGLAGKALNVKIPARANPTERRILDLFLHDWDSKLEPLLPIHRKLTALTRIVNNKFIGKSIAFDQTGVMQFWSAGGGNIRVDQLSSGEQHLLALFTRLLFSAQQGSVVLVDEPEISLHAAWKHAFIEDIEEVAKLTDLTVVLATHSTAIINGRWELVQELGNATQRN
jgi:ABC-type lipoprotein export system ATPase subunit